MAYQQIGTRRGVEKELSWGFHENLQSPGKRKVWLLTVFSSYLEHRQFILSTSSRRQHHLCQWMPKSKESIKVCKVQIHEILNRLWLMVHQKSYNGAWCPLFVYHSSSCSTLLYAGSTHIITSFDFKKGLRLCICDCDKRILPQRTTILVFIAECKALPWQMKGTCYWWSNLWRPSNRGLSNDITLRQ